MTVRRLTEDGDIATNGNHFIGGIQETAQTVKTRVKLIEGEYFRNTAEGTPWFSRILPNTIDQALKESEIKRIITRTQNVGGIISFDFEFEREQRKISINSNIVDNSGEREEIILSEVF